MPADPTTVALAAAGVASLTGAIAWRQAARHGRRARLVRRFASPLPDRRARAGVELVGLGLGRAANPILAHVVEEDDPHVRVLIAMAVARRQWEPSGSARVAALRQWARAELEHQGFEVVGFGPAFTRLADMGGPRRGPPRGAPRGPSGGGRREPHRAAAVMTTVLVTGAGGPAGVSVIRSLMDGGHHVIAVDADPLAAGMYLAAEHAAVAPAVEAESFVSDLADAAKRFHVEVVVCTVGEEMLVLSGREHDLAGA